MAATDFIPLVNGAAYAWANIRTQLLGQTVAGITAVSYEDTQEKVNNYGAGVNPVSRGMGKVESKASLTLEMKELERIQAALPPGGRIQDIAPFPIVVSYLNPSNALITHTLHNCEFTNNKRDIKTGDTNIECELELIISHISWS
jgi:hypothetical protein